MYIAAKVVIFFGFLPHLMDKSQTNAKRTLEFAISCILFLFCFLLFPSLFSPITWSFFLPRPEKHFPQPVKNSISALPVADSHPSH